MLGYLFWESLVPGFPATRLPQGPHIERVPGAAPETGSAAANQRTGQVSFSSRALPSRARSVTVWHPAPQLCLCSPQGQGFQNKTNSVFGASFGYKAVCTCPGHHHCWDHPPLSCSHGLDYLWFSSDIRATVIVWCWDAHCSELTPCLACLSSTGFCGKSLL